MLKFPTEHIMVMLKHTKVMLKHIKVMMKHINPMTHEGASSRLQWGFVKPAVVITDWAYMGFNTKSWDK